jgi:hypothetical protein
MPGSTASKRYWRKRSCVITLAGRHAVPSIASSVSPLRRGPRIIRRCVALAVAKIFGQKLAHWSLSVCGIGLATVRHPISRRSALVARTRTSFAAPSAEITSFSPT